MCVCVCVCVCVRERERERERERAQMCPTICNPLDYSSPGSSVHRVIPGKNTGVGCHFLLHNASILAWDNPMDRAAWWAVVHRVAKGSDST